MMKSEIKVYIQQFIKKILISEYFILVLLAFYVMVIFPFYPTILGAYNIRDVLSNIWPLLIVAVGQTFVLLTGGVDLSQASVMALTSVIAAVFIAQVGNPDLMGDSPLWGSLITENGGVLAHNVFGVPITVIIVLSVGALIGLINGISVTYLKMPPFMVTLVAMMFFSGFAIYLTKSVNIEDLSENFKFLGNGNILFDIITMPMLICIALVILAHIILSKTLLGSYIYATGTNATVAKISGVPTEKVIISAYVISSISATIASIFYSARLGMGSPVLGSTQLIDIVGVNVIGGISLFGGIGKITNTIVGVVFFVVVTNTLNLFNLPFYFIDMVRGTIILFAVILDIWSHKRKKI